MATAQVEAWVGARKGSINEAARGIDSTLADAALGRMMLHRRRAVAASVIGEFFARVGNGYTPYLEGRASAAPLDPAGERAIAEQAGELVVTLRGMAAPLLFERALLAEADNRFGDALLDFQAVLAAYPGFLAGAIAAARMALAVGDPGEAIRSLAAVEREIAHTRDGTALLADATRAIGLHEAASRYDLATLICRGAYDSRGNDCAPVDLTGKIADDERMPQTLYLEGQVDGSVICNAGGIYYRVSSLLGTLLSVLDRNRSLSTMRSLGPGGGSGSSSGAIGQAGQISGYFEAATAKLWLSLEGRAPNGFALLRTSSVRLGSWLGWLTASVLRLIVRVAGAVAIFLYRLYRRLPGPFRAIAHKVVRSQTKLVRSLVRDTVGPRLGPRGGWRFFLPLSQPTARQLVTTRYQSGLARIFGVSQLPIAPDSIASVAGSQGQLANTDLKTRSADAVLVEKQSNGKLPPVAENVLHRLVSESGFLRSPSPLS